MREKQLKDPQLPVSDMKQVRKKNPKILAVLATYVPQGKVEHVPARSSKTPDFYHYIMRIR